MLTCLVVDENTRETDIASSLDLRIKAKNIKCISRKTQISNVIEKTDQKDIKERYQELLISYDNINKELNDQYVANLDLNTQLQKVKSDFERYKLEKITENGDCDETEDDASSENWDDSDETEDDSNSENGDDSDETEDDSNSEKGDSDDIEDEFISEKDFEKPDDRENNELSIEEDLEESEEYEDGCERSVSKDYGEINYKHKYIDLKQKYPISPPM